MHKLRLQLLSFAFATERKKWLGMSQKRWLQILLAALFVFGLIRQAWWIAIACAVLFLILNFIYRWGQHRGYTLFVETRSPAEPWMDKELSEAQKLPVRATGHFLVGETERRLILVSGKCWQLPIGEIVLMLEAAPGRFAYQFIDLKAIEQVRYGEIWFNNSYEIAIEAVFQTDWIQADDQIKLGGDTEADMSKRMGKRVVVLSFDSVDDARTVWDKLDNR